MLKGKKILLGITGSIAAYKAAILIRLLVKSGAEVKVIMTPHAKEFITPLTFATLSKNPILLDFFNPENGDWNSHVDLGLWSDLYLIAPATANTIAKMTTGIADNLLLTSYLSARCTVMIVPAMDFDMYSHPATQNNLKILQLRGNIIIESAFGELASGLEGKGRMEEPEKIMQAIIDFFSFQNKLSGKTILITAGPTYETIDPIRFIGNYSSGKMGYAIAETCANYGAKVILVSGPVKIQTNHPNIFTINVTSVTEMYDACMKYFPETNATIMAAAVADYTPLHVSGEKIKRTSENFLLELIPTHDIIFELGKIKKQGQILIGFALETTDELNNAKQKLKKKNLDFIVLNSLSESGSGFNYDTNKITIIEQDNKITNFELKSKSLVAVDIVNKLCSYLLK
jgi:phosphopantothenoylcysteine decarboxylase/phosphopantothenate--cysteine ligase